MTSLVQVVTSLFAFVTSLFEFVTSLFEFVTSKIRALKRPCPMSLRRWLSRGCGECDSSWYLNDTLSSWNSDLSPQRWLCLVSLRWWLSTTVVSVVVRFFKQHIKFVRHWSKPSMVAESSVAQAVAAHSCTTCGNSSCLDEFLNWWHPDPGFRRALSSWADRRLWPRSVSHELNVLFKKTNHLKFVRHWSKGSV